MADTYSTNLRLTLMESGAHDSTWGSTLNSQLQLVEAAIAGRAAITHDNTANYTLTTANGSADEARRMIIDIGGALSAARNAVVPTQTKFYVVKNSTTGGYAVTVKTSGGTGIAVPNGKTMLLFCDGTNVVESIDQIVGTLTVGGAITANGGVTVPAGQTVNGAGAINISGNITGAAISGTTGTFTGVVKVGTGAALTSNQLMINAPNATATLLQIYQDSQESWTLGMEASSTTLKLKASATEILSATNLGAVTIPSLAGVGTRNVVVDANGVLSAP